MRKTATALLLALAMGCAQAQPISFTSSTYTTSAFADVDVDFDGTSDSSDGPFDFISPPDLLPIASSASVTVGADSATGDAMADATSLSASSTATSVAGLAFGSAVTTFLGEFTSPDGLLSLLVDFEDTTAGAAGSTLAVILAVDGVALFDAIFASTELIAGDFPVSPGLPGTLEITLISSASAFADAASNSATATFSLDSVAASVPEPATLALILGGFGLMGWFRRPGGCRRRA